METHSIYYDKLIKLTNAISECKDPEEVAITTAASIKTTFNVKGCAVFIVDGNTRKLGLAGSSGLSEEYLNKGPIYFIQSIKEAKYAVPIAIYDALDDPRVAYPEAARKEGIASVLGVPMVAHGRIIGAIRIYTSEPWEFSIHDINLAQAVSQICGMALDMCRMYKGYKTSIDILKNMRKKEPVEYA